MDEIYVNTDFVKPDKFNISTNPTGPMSSERRCHGAVILSLSLLSVFLLAGLIGLAVHYHDLAAELSSVKANLSEHVQITDNKSLPLTEERDQLNSTLTEVTKVHEELHHLSESNEGLAAELSSVKASLSEHLQKSLSLTKERDQLNSTLIEVTKELDKLQCLHNYKKTCPSGWNIFNCSCYLLSAQYDSWDKGREDCRRRGADLVVVDTPEEQTFVSGFTPYDIWIGLTDNEKEGVWKWVDGTPLNFRYWANNEPNNGGSRFGEENCAHISMGKTRNWNDVSCSRSFKWACEKRAS
ncbi:hypothetical protein INR49_027020 [Caranx melampygus]|nr:hypothetical protein INR49_027020 [Caranx melampygus]